MRRSWLAAVLTAAVLIGLFPAGALAETPPLPDSIAAVGDSITQAASSGGTLGTDYPANSWSTGTNASVNGHYPRLVALNPAIGGNAHNFSVSGARMVHLNGQMQQAASVQPDYLTVLIGGNDVCTDSEAQMTSVADFRAQLELAMATLIGGSPDTNIYVVSIPRVKGLWELFRNDWWARFIWGLAGICQSMLVNPTSTQQADVDRRARVDQRNRDFNTVLAEVCAATPRCLSDGGAAYSTPFVAADASGDFFHPSIQGQAKLAQVSWAAGYWPNGAPPANEPPVAAFTSSCDGLTCSFDATGSTDDRAIATYAWTFGTDSSGTGATVSHPFSAAGTHTVTLLITDDDGATDSVTHDVTVAAPPPAGSVHVADLAGLAAARKGGWTATVTVRVADGAGAPVGGATVTGSWSTGAGGGCTTSGAGTCTFSMNLAKKATSATWTVADITHATLAYAPAANVETAVSVTRP